jgi:hypothetical protein
MPTTSTTASTAVGADEHGNPTTGPTEAIERYDVAMDRLVRFHPDVVGQMASLVEEHPSFAMGQALGAYMYLMSTDGRDLEGARPFVAALDAAPRNDRESAHAGAISAWLSGDWHGAARRLDDLLVQWPTDLLAVMLGHTLDFFVGDARNLRDRIGRSVAAFDPDHPHYGFVRGMQAFGLEESGHYGLAEQVGIEAVERNPDDVWGIHAVTHVFEMQGRVQDGTTFLERRVEDWGAGNLFTVHNWWHLALFQLEVGRHERVLEIYDREVHHSTSNNVPLELVDASAMLWRLYLDGVDTGARFQALADAWAAALDAGGSWYVFNDVHAVMALLGAGRRDDALAVVRRLADDVETGAGGSNTWMTAEVGLPAARALIAFDDGRNDEAIADLWPARRVFHHFGGSHAQRDVLQRTLVEAAIRGGRMQLAERLIAERLALRPTGAFALDRLPRLAGS